VALGLKYLAAQYAIKTPLFLRSGVFFSQSIFPPASLYGMELIHLLLYFAIFYHELRLKSTLKIK